MGIEFQFKKTPETISARSVPEQLARKLGSGIRLPVNIVNNKWDVIDGTQKVKQDIYVALATPVKTRLGQADFGSMIPFYCFEPFTALIASQIENAAWDALTIWVPQITVKDIFVDDSAANDHVANLIIKYVIKGTSALDDVSIVLASPDTVQLPPGRFVIGGRQFFPAD